MITANTESSHQANNCTAIPYAALGEIITIGRGMPIFVPIESLPASILSNESPSGKRWVFRARGSNTCETCMQYDGKVYTDLSEAPKLPLHPNCDCFLEEQNPGTEAYDAILSTAVALPSQGRLDRALTSSGLDATLRLAHAWKESSWREDAKNPRSTAMGMYQILDGTKKDAEDRVWDRMVSSKNNPLKDKGAEGDWRKDRKLASQGHYVYLLDRIASSGGDLREGLAKYYGSPDRQANLDYADSVIKMAKILDKYAQDYDGNLSKALSERYDEIARKLDAAR